MVHGADDVALVLQELQHLLQHSLTQARIQAQASAGQDVPEVAALLHVVWFLAVFLNDMMDLSVQFFVFSGYIEEVIETTIFLVNESFFLQELYSILKYTMNCLGCGVILKICLSASFSRTGLWKGWS